MTQTTKAQQTISQEAAQDLLEALDSALQAIQLIVALTEDESVKRHFNDGDTLKRGYAAFRKATEEENG